MPLVPKLESKMKSAVLVPVLVKRPVNVAVVVAYIGFIIWLITKP